MAEEWRDVVGLEELYEVSDEGRVAGKERYVGSGHNLRKCERRVLKARQGREGYLTVRLHRDGWTTDKMVHLLVVEAFVGPRPDGMVACHYDGDKTNARLDNLRWDTPKGNAADDVRNGVRRRGRKITFETLTEHQVRMIRWRYKEVGTADMPGLAEEFGVAIWDIYSILSRKVWAHLPEDVTEPKRHVRRRPVGSGDSGGVNE